MGVDSKSTRIIYSIYPILNSTIYRYNSSSLLHREAIDVVIPSIRYAQIAIVIFGMYGVNLFLSRVPKYIILVQDGKYTRAEEVFSKYILCSIKQLYIF